MIRKGDKVRISPDWQDAGDAEIEFIAIENEEGGRVSIEAQLGLPINPVQTVNVAMLENLPKKSSDPQS